MPNERGIKRDKELDVESRLEAWGASKPAREVSSPLRERIERKLAASLNPVKTLPSARWLALGFLAIFVVGAAICVQATDNYGLRLMNAGQIAAMTTIFAAGAIGFSVALAQRMIPGARALISPGHLLLLSGIVLAAGIAWAFPWSATGAFLSEGWPCSAMEAEIAIPAAVLFWFVARRGAPFIGPGFGAAVGALAGLLAMTVQQFQCMFQRAPHLLIWHAGAAAALTGLGALSGAVARQFESRKGGSR
ncbi:MAG TPA: NrsF family protein [Bryobacteraceae bacterium]